MINTDKLFEAAKEAAVEAGKIQLSFFNKKKQISHKLNEFDLVTNADKAAEEKIISVINTHFPEHDFLGEESGLHKENKSEYIWVIDPIDGTTNYAHNFPHFAVSIGLMYKGELVLGVVYDAFKKEMFWAAEGVGAFLNDEKIHVSMVENLNESLLSTGFPCERADILEENLAYFREMLFKTQAIRRPGSASLDLCYVACGRLDGFWELNLSPWDTAAGTVIIRQAGGKVTNFETEQYDMYVKNILASNGLIHDKIYSVIKECKEKLK